MIRYLISFILLFFHIQSWAQVCPQNFSRISTSCIKEKLNNEVTKPIVISSELIGNIYFYVTALGEYGKLKISSVSVSNTECTLFLDAATFTTKTDFIPNSSISISVERNHWLKNKIYLDREGTSALELLRKDKSCGIVLTGGTKLYYYKKEVEGLKQEDNYLLFYAPLVLVFFAIFIIVQVFMEDQDKYKTQEALEEAENDNKGSEEFLFLKITKPFYKRYFLPIIQASKGKQKIKNAYKQKLANAGLSKQMTPEEFVALKFFMILGGPFTFLFIRWLAEETWPLSITPLMGIVGYFYPDIWLSGLIKKRADEVLRAMPFIVDMLALSVEAGLDFMAAIQRVIEKAPRSPLVEEFETLIRETKIGSSRAEGLRQLGWRVNMIEINSFCATLIAADSVGASIGPILKQLSGELRVKRSARAEQLGATAATKILMPMIIFILPAVLIAIFTPMILKMMRGGE